LGYWFARTPNEKTASDQDRSEGEVAQPLSTGEAEEHEAKGNCSRGQENRTQDLVVKDIQRVVEQTEGFVD